MIDPLNDIIAENLGQRGRRAGELACRADTMAGLGKHGRLGCSSEVEASCAAEALSHFASFYNVSGASKTHRHATDFYAEFTSIHVQHTIRAASY